jgi:hypothetical protein
MIFVVPGQQGGLDFSDAFPSMVRHREEKYVSTNKDPVKAWLEMVDQLSKTAPGSGTPEFLQATFAPMQQQFDLLQQGSRSRLSSA